MSVCAETIYRACYANDPRSGLAAGTWAKLPRRCRRRRPRSVAQAQKPSPLGEYRPVADRPADVEDRTEPGHWDRDLIVGKANLTAAVTIAERTSRYCLTAALPDGYSAPQLPAADPQITPDTQNFRVSLLGLPGPSSQGVTVRFHARR